MAITRLTTNCAGKERLRPSSAFVLAIAKRCCFQQIACSIALAGMAVSIALNTSVACILADSTNKSLRCTTLNFHSWEQCLLYMSLRLN